MSIQTLSKRDFIVLCLILAVLVLGITLRLTNLDVKQRTPDEQIYTYYGKALLDGGIANYRQVVEKYNLSEELWSYPTPVRIGYVYLAAGIMKLVGWADVRVLAYISCVSSILSLLLLVLVGLRFFNRWVTLVALGWMSVSAMDLAIAQRAWQDGVLALVALLLVYVCAEISYKRRRVSWFILLGGLGSFCMLIKETGIVIYGLCILWVLWVTFVKEKSLVRSLFVVFVSLCSIAISIFLISKACGGFLNVIDATKHNISSLAVNEYALIYNSGPWFRILQGFFFSSPVAAVLSLVGIIAVVWPVKGLEKRKGILGIIFFTLSFTVISMFPQNLRNLRFFSVVFIPFYLMAGVGSYYIMRFLKNRLKSPYFYLGTLAIILVISAACFFDYLNFKAIFVLKETPDLAVKLLIENSLYNFFE